MLREFKEFAIKGNVVDMAVGIMIGAAFTAVVSSTVEDVLTPPLKLLSEDFDLSGFFAVLREGNPGGPYTSLDQARQSGAVVIAWGRLLDKALTFVMTAGLLFVVVRWMNRLRRPTTPPAPTTRACPFCCSHVAQEARRCPHCTSELEPIGS